MSKQSLIEEFETLHQQLILLVNHFPSKNREKIIFDQWSLKDVLIHITAWNKNDSSRFEAIINNKDPRLTWVDDLDEFNSKEVSKAKGLSWETIYKEFVLSGNNLTKIARQLPDNQWNTTIDPDSKMTIKGDFVKAIEHYEKEHLPQISKFLNT